MRTKGRRSNFRVVVEPRRMGNFGSISVSDRLLYGRSAQDLDRWESDMEERCQHIANEVKRHVDNVGSAYVESDQDDVCSYCGWAWTEESTVYNGGCCDRDQREEDERAAAAQLPLRE